jgi:hypothetical protein
MDGAHGAAIQHLLLLSFACAMMCQGCIMNTGGDQIKVGNISGSKGVAIGRQAQATVTESYGVTGAELTKLFATVYQRIDARPPDPDVDKAELAETVQKVEEEAKKGEEANPNRVQRLLKTLGLMAPDILEVTLACLTSPVAGITTALKKVAEKAKAEASAG